MFSSLQVVVSPSVTTVCGCDIDLFGGIIDGCDGIDTFRVCDESDKSVGTDTVGLFGIFSCSYNVFRSVNNVINALS